MHLGLGHGIVHDIDSLNVSGTYHKRFNFQTYDGTVWTLGSWIEGIGNSDLGGLLGSALAQPTCDCGKNIICFKQNGTWVYHNTNYSSLNCVNDALAIRSMEIPETTVTLSPNPVTGVSILKTNTGSVFTRFSVYSITGASVQTQKIAHATEVSIHKADYANGIYWYRVQDDKGHTTTGKFVVQ